jgi:hypothetical protein
MANNPGGGMRNPATEIEAHESAHTKGYGANHAGTGQHPESLTDASSVAASRNETPQADIPQADTSRA